MAISPGYEYDIFVSYAHLDNPAAEPWVTNFVDRLDAELRRRLKSGRELKIFFDREATGANDQLPKLLETVRKSALFLAIGSPAFADSTWAKDELDAFLNQSNDPSRIFLIELLPLNQGDHYPDPVRQHIRQPFWRKDRNSHTPMSLSPDSDFEDFRSQLNRLAVDLREKVHAFAVSPRQALQPSVPSNTRAGQPTGKTVLLAQTTEDIEEEVEQVRSYLKQFGVTVLPSTSYPQGGEAFRAAVAADVAQAGLFVQLLSKRRGRTPPDLTEGYTLCQLELAKSAGLPVMQWHQPDLEVDKITDSTYRSALSSDTVVVSGLEAFKRMVVDQLAKPKPEPKSANKNSSTVFINADDTDMPAAKQIRDGLMGSLSTILPWKGASPQERHEDMVRALTESDVLVFLFGMAPDAWVRSQLMNYKKFEHKRESPPRLIALCVGPPPPKPAQGDIGVTIPNTRIIECSGEWDMESIRALIAEFAQ